MIDGLNGIAFKDDSCIVEVVGNKYYSDNPRVEFILEDIQMKKIIDKLIELGMEKEDAKTFIDEVKAGYILKEEYDVLQGQMTVYEEKTKELSKTVKTLQKDVDASEALKLKLEDLENNLASKDKEIEKVKFDYKLEAKMKEVGAKNIKAIKALINMEDVKLND